MSATPPRVISIIGWSGSGKTTFLEKIVAILSVQGLRVGVIKHHGHESTVDVEGKDTWRYEQAGAHSVIVSSPSEYAIIRKTSREKTLAELVALIDSECDVLFTEGYRDQARYIVEFSRRDHRLEGIIEVRCLTALISDNESLISQARKRDVPVFALDDYEEFARFVRELSLKG